MVMPSLLYAAVLVFFLGFELFGLPLVLGDPERILVLATYLYKLTNKLGTPSYQLMAVVVVAIFVDRRCRWSASSASCCAGQPLRGGEGQGRRASARCRSAPGAGRPWG